MQPLKLAMLAGAAVLVSASPVAAQMNMNMPAMNMPGMKMPMQKKAPAKKQAGPKKAAIGKRSTTKAPAKQAAASKKPTATKASGRRPAKKAGMAGMDMSGHDMSGHDMSAMPGMNMPQGQSMQNMPGMNMPQGQSMQNMPGMNMPQGQSMENMPGMQMPGQAGSTAAPVGTNQAAGNTPAPPLPTDHAADQVYGAPNMAMGRHHLVTFHGGQKTYQVMNNLMEYQARKGRDGYEWDSQAWYGGDINRLWIKSQGDGTFGRSVDRAEVQGLYSHAIGPYFNLQGGLRYDIKPNPSRVYATIGVEGLAPSFFELDSALFLSNKGELLGRVEGYYDQRITERLILQPRAELNFAAQNSRSIGVGAGLSDAELGLRLRYDIRREFAPYLGVQYKRAFGKTRTYLREEGESAGGFEFVAGVRSWF